MPKIAIICGGNLGSYSLTIDSILCNIIEPNNADVFVLTSNSKNYVHASTNKLSDETNIFTSVTENDFDRIRNCFGKHLKYLECTENIKNYESILELHKEKLKKRLRWVNKKGTEEIVGFDENTKTMIHDVRYIEQYLRLQYLMQQVKNYDYVMRVRIDQYFGTKIIVTGKQKNTLWYSSMDNFFYGSIDIMEKVCSKFIDKIGMYKVDFSTRASDGHKINYGLTSEPQFRSFMNEIINNSGTTVYPTNINAGWRLSKPNAVCTIHSQYNSELERKSKNLTMEEYYKFTEAEVPGYPNELIDKTIWTYYLF